jgi:hypothetical protein
MNGVYTNLAKKRAEQSKEPSTQGAVPPPSIGQEEQVAPMGISPASTPAPPQPQSGKKQNTPLNKPATGKSMNALQVKQEKFEKYSTYLRPGYKKILKSISNDRDCKSYEVLDEALTLFFESRKK